MTTSLKSINLQIKCRLPSKGLGPGQSKSRNFKSSKMSVSDLDICNLAFEGNLVKLKEKLEERKDLIRTKDQVVLILLNLFNGIVETNLEQLPCRSN